MQVFRLPDGTEIRKGDRRDQAIEFVSRYLRDERGMTDVQISFHQVQPPNLRDSAKARHRRDS
jgi:sirohydrochlorin ferrochelatase